MGDGVNRNLPCRCGSSLKYKNCCLNHSKKIDPVKPNSFQEITDERDSVFKSEFSHRVRSVTGYWAEDYMKPVKSLAGDWLEVYADESCINNELFSVGLVVVKKNQEIFNDVNAKLDKLVQEYSIKDIHFTKIFGRDKILNDRTVEFARKYADIISLLGASCYSVCDYKKNILHLFKIDGKPVEDLSNEDIYHALLWRCMEKVINKCKEDSIIEIWQEQQNNFSEKVLNRQKIGLFQGLGMTLPKFRDKYVSINMNLQITYKRGLIRSSLPDLVSYASCGIQNKLNKNINNKKIIKSNLYLLELLKMSFQDHSGLASGELVALVDKTVIDSFNYS